MPKNMKAFKEKKFHKPIREIGIHKNHNSPFLDDREFLETEKKEEWKKLGKHPFNQVIQTLENQTGRSYRDDDSFISLNIARLTLALSKQKDLTYIKSKIRAFRGNEA